MRFKLILLVSLIAAILGAGISIIIMETAARGLDFAQLHSRGSSTTLLSLGLVLPPTVTALLAGIFVYRHTAKRRKLQASLAGILVLLLCAVEFTLLVFVMQMFD